MPTPISSAVLGVLAEGAIDSIVRSLGRGEAEEDIYRGLREQYPDVSPQALRSVLDRGLAAAEAGRGYADEDIGYVPELRDIPIDPTMRDPAGRESARFRYEGTYDYISPKTDRSRRWYYSFETDQLLDAGELADRVYEEYAREHRENPSWEIEEDELLGRFLGFSPRSLRRRY